MNLHEYQGKEILRSYGARVPAFYLAYTPEEAVEAARKIMNETGKKSVVLKAQIHAGGRGKAGGIKLASSLEEVYSKAKELIGKVLVTPQTGPSGKKVRKIIVSEDAYEGIPPDSISELYLSMLIDRQKEEYVLVFSSAGGVEIEELSAKHPEKIYKCHISPLTGLSEYHIRRLIKFAGLYENFSREIQEELYNAVKGIYRAFTENYASLIEINPLAIVNNKIVFLDCKFVIDDNALNKKPELASYRDRDEEDELEREANDVGLSFIRLNGNIGCMVNGAGLAMATMDIIKYFGGEPANFLDVGGTADVDRIKTGFKILLRTPEVKAVFVNIFGGIVRCDRVAEAIIHAFKETPDIKIPLIVRMLGTNSDIAKDMLKNSGIEVTFIDNFETAASWIKKIVSA